MPVLGAPIALIVIGLILLVVAYNVLLPFPLGPIFRILGWLLFILGIVDLVLALLGQSNLLVGPGIGLAFVGLLLVLLAYNVSMQRPLNRVCLVLGWVFIIVGVAYFLLTLSGSDLRLHGSTGYLAGFGVLPFLGLISGAGIPPIPQPGAPEPAPAPAPAMPAPTRDPDPGGSTGGYQMRWLVNIVVTVLLVLIDAPAVLEKIGWAQLGIPDLWANWILAISTFAAILGNFWLPSVFATPTQARLLAERAIRGHTGAARRLHELVQSQYRLTN